jgi:hypothetical protein
MVKKITFQTLAHQIAEGFAKRGKEINELTESVAFVVKHMATKDDIAAVRREMATKEQLVGLHTQVNSIERQLSETRAEIRLGDLEQKVFGEVRR